jgi:DNA-binding PadR family transcriptional regulator
VLQGLQLRKAILETLHSRKGEAPEAGLVKEEELSKILKADHDRLDAHFVFLERAGYISSLRMPGPEGTRLRFITITAEGEKYLRNAKNFETVKATDSPFKVIEKGDEKLVGDVAELRAMVDKSDWVLDEEKPEILAKVDELAKVLKSDRFDPGAVSSLKLYFERHKWIAPHVQALIRKQYGL